MKLILKKYFLSLPNLVYLFVLFILILFLFKINIIAQDLSEETKIGIAFSEITWKEIHSSDYNYYFIQSWEMFLMNHHIAYEVFTDEDLDDYNFDEVDILILPGIEILSVDAVQNINDFMNSGKSVFVLGSIGSYKSPLRKRFNNVLQEICGFSANEFPNANNSGFLVNLQGNNPLIDESINKKISVLGNLQVYYSDIYSGRASIGHYIKNDESNINGDAVIYGKSGNAGFAWMGFQISQIADGTELNSVAEKLILNILKYLNNEPVISINNFPGEASNAIIICNRIIDGKKFTDFINNSVTLHNIKADNFVKPDFVLSNEIDLMSLSDFGNIFLIFDPVDFIDKSNPGINNVFNEASGKLNSLTNQNTAGIWYVNYSSTITEIDSIFNNKTKFILYDSKLKLHETSYSSCDVINLEWIDKSILDNRSNITNKIKNVFQKEQVVSLLLYDGFNYQNSLSDTEFEELNVEFTTNDCWFTSINKLMNWMDTKGKVSYGLSTHGENGDIILQIKNNNRVKVENLCLNLILPGIFSNNISLTQPGMNLHFDYKNNMYKLQIESINPGNEKSINLTR